MEAILYVKDFSFGVFLNGVKAVDEGGIQSGIFTGGTWHPLLYLPLSPPPPPLILPLGGERGGKLHFMQ